MAGRTDLPEEHIGRIPGQQVRQERPSLPKVVPYVLRSHS